MKQRHGIGIGGNWGVKMKGFGAEFDRTAIAVSRAGQGKEGEVGVGGHGFEEALFEGLAKLFFGGHPDDFSGCNLIERPFFCAVKLNDGATILHAQVSGNVADDKEAVIHVSVGDEEKVKQLGPPGDFLGFELLGKMKGEHIFSKDRAGKSIYFTL